MKRKIKLTFQIIVAVLILTLLAMLITGSLILFRGFGNNAPFTYMIILGNKIEGSEPSPLLSDRIDAAVKYMEKNPQVIAVATGYKSENADISEAQCIYNNLVQRGISPQRILIDECATTTQENFQYALELIEKNSGHLPKNIGVLSSEFHLLRAKMIAQSCDINPSLIPAHTSDTKAFLTYFLREIFMVWYDGLKLTFRQSA